LRSKGLLFLGIVIALAILSGVGFILKPFNWGLDIKGGVMITYQIDKASLKSGMTMEEARNLVIIVLEHRATGSLGVSEAPVQAKGDDQVVVELPGFKDKDEAERVMGSSAQIQIMDAKNVVTTTAPYREYTERSDTEHETSSPEVDFVDKSGKVITTKDKEAYKKIQEGWEPIIVGDEMSRADMEHSPSGGYMPSMKFSPSGSEKMERWSRANNRRGEMIAEVLDGVVISIAPIKDGAVLSEGAVIEGNFNSDYVRTLRDLLNSGALPAKLNKIGSMNVDPVIGQHALNQIVTAGVIAFAVIAVFMLVYYVFPGVIALLALTLYVLFTLTVLKLVGATFSLAAIAGFVLSVGMAVDANILVFERLKEELRSGKTLQHAIELGFRRALPAIIDSNACTFLTAMVLYNLGTGPVKGFATTLIIGVAISLFTAVTVTRSLLVFFFEFGLGSHPSWYGLSRQWFGESLEKGATKKPLQIVNKAGRYFFISALTIVPGVIFFAMGGIKQNVEFTGGTEITYSVKDQNVTAPQIAANLEKSGIQGANVTLGSDGPNKVVYVTIPKSSKMANGTADVNQQIAQAAGITADPARTTSYDVSGTIQSETIRNAVLGVIFSSILIILYLALRFGIALGGFVIGLRFSVSAILALAHDILVVLGLAAVTGYLLGWQISALFISAMLTVIGFSTHDTIVIFDRIRENLRRPLPGEDSENLINRSITQSVARSINTSMTVIVTLAILIGFGSATPELKLFNAAMLIGIISGTYSSIFNAAPILYLWDKAIAKKNPGKTLLGIVASNKIRVRTTAGVLPDAAPAATAPAAAGTAQYGQVKRRRASDVERSKRSIDDEE
jgi:SecD/SecF fusion protein